MKLVRCESEPRLSPLAAIGGCCRCGASLLRWLLLLPETDPRSSPGGHRAMVIAIPRAACRECIAWLAIVLVAGCLGTVASAQEVIAHRGASHDAPENTLAAFRLAWRRGADGIEGDFYLTRDGQIVCIHDDTTKRTCGVDWKVAEHTLRELRRLDAGAWKAERYRGERIPTLGEVLAVVPEGKRIFIEIKCGPEIIPKLKEVLAASSLRPHQIAVIAFDERVIAQTRKQIPQVKAYWLLGYKQDEQTGQWSPTLAEVLSTLRRIDAHGLDTHANMEVVDKDFVRALRRAGFELHVWTIDQPAEALQAKRLGVDSITTNRPAMIRACLAETARGGRGWEHSGNNPSVHPCTAGTAPHTRPK